MKGVFRSGKSKILVEVVAFLICNAMGTIAFADTKPPIRYDTPKCQGDVMIEIGGIRMMVPRDSMFTIESGQELKDWDHPRYNCDLRFIPKMRKYTNNTGWSLTNPKQFVGSTIVQILDRGIKKFHWKMQEDSAFGMKILKKGLTEYYQLPIDSAKTANHEPVLLWCSPSSCDTTYYMPSGLVLWYRFHREIVPTEKFPSFDLELRHKIARRRQPKPDRMYRQAP